MLARHRGESVGAQLGFLGAPSQSSGGDRAEPLFRRVLFEVRTETVFGESVYIVGSTPQLGAWNPKRGIRMTTNEDTYPIWRCEPLLLNEGGEGSCEYKFVVVSPNDEVRWEPLPNNRRLVLGGDEVQVIADWGSLDALPQRVVRSAGPPSLPSVVELREEHSAASRVSSGFDEGAEHQKLTPIAPSPPSTGASVHGGAATGTAAAEALSREATGGPSSRLLVVQYKLPFKLSRAADGTWSGAWDDDALLATSVQGGRHLMGSLDLEVIFMGIPKLSHGTNPDLSAADQEAVQKLLREHACIPVFLPKEAREAHFNYASTVLWPMMHNQIPDRHAGGQGGDGALVGSWWKGYQTTNDAFAQAVKTSMRAGDMVWVHSHFLLLLPLSLRAARIPASCTVSTFLHTPFPSPEVWRVLPHRVQLLQGMLASHVIGFHLFECAADPLCSRTHALCPRPLPPPSQPVWDAPPPPKAAPRVVSRRLASCRVVSRCVASCRVGSPRRLGGRCSALPQVRAPFHDELPAAARAGRERRRRAGRRRALDRSRLAPRHDHRLSRRHRLRRDPPPPRLFRDGEQSRGDAERATRAEGPHARRRRRAPQQAAGRRSQAARL